MILILLLLLFLIIILCLYFYRWETYSSNLSKTDIFINTHHKNIFIDCFHYQNIFYLAPYHSQNLDERFKEIKKKYRDRFFILLDGEPNPIKHIDADLIISTKSRRESYPEGAPSIFLPYFIYSFLQVGRDPSILVKKANEAPMRKSKFCCFMYSNCDEKYAGVKKRKEFYHLLDQKSGNRVDNLGKCYNASYKTNGWWHDNFKIYQEYKFVIAFENDLIDGYVSEKIWVPMASRSIPVYLGAPDIGNFFNVKSFINVLDYKNFDECINHILRIDQDDALYREIQRQPFLIHNSLSSLDFSYLYGGKFYQELGLKLPKEYSEFIRPCQLYAEFFLFLSDHQQTIADAKKSRFFNDCKLITTRPEDYLKTSGAIIIYCGRGALFNGCRYKQIRNYFEMIRNRHFILFLNHENRIDDRFFLCRDNQFTRDFFHNGNAFDDLKRDEYFLSRDFVDQIAPFYI